MFKRYIKTVLLAAIFFGAVFGLSQSKVLAASDQTGLSAKVSELQKLIVGFQVRLAVLAGRDKIPADFVFGRELKLNDYNSAVVYLQLILQSESVYCQQCQVTGFFGRGTLQGLAAFQQKYAAEILVPQHLSKLNGLFDDLTRTKLNKLLKSQNAVEPQEAAFSSPSPLVLPQVAGASTVKSNGDCVVKAPSVCYLLSPEDNQANLPLSLTLSWEGPEQWGRNCSDNKKFRLQIDNDIDFSSPLVDILLPAKQKSYFLSPTVLSADTIYHWRVRAENGIAGEYVSRAFGVSFSPGLDLRVNNFHGPITINYGNSVLLSWESSRATNCRASGDWQGDKPMKGSEKIEKLTTGQTYHLKCAGLGGSSEAEVVVNVLPLPTLFLDLKASQDSQVWQEGLAAKLPLNVSVRAEVSGTVAGLVTYRIDCDSDNVWEASFSGVNEEIKIVSNVCDYPDLGIYQLKTRIERSGLAVEKTLPIVVFAVVEPDLEVIAIDQIPAKLANSNSKVVYTAKVINKGPAIDEETRYYWLVNYIAQMVGKIPALKTGETAVFSFSTTFSSLPAKVEFRADVENKLAEASETNNSLTIIQK